jgi:hypothetical protein
MQPIRKLIAVAVATVAVVGVTVTQIKPSPTPGGTPTAITTTVPTTKPTTKIVHQFDKPVAYIVGHHQGATAWTKPIQARVWFVDVQNYADVAYNAMITPKGETWSGRGEQYASAASYGLNHNSVAFCWLGNKNKDPVTDAQLVAAAVYVKAARVRHPGAKLIGHRDVEKITGIKATTECPGNITVKQDSLRAVWLLVCGYSLPEAKRRAAAGL